MSLTGALCVPEHKEPPAEPFWWRQRPNSVTDQHDNPFHRRPTMNACFWTHKGCLNQARRGHRQLSCIWKASIKVGIQMKGSREEVVKNAPLQLSLFSINHNDCVIYQNGEKWCIKSWVQVTQIHKQWLQRQLEVTQHKKWNRSWQIAPDLQVLFFCVTPKSSTSLFPNK